MTARQELLLMNLKALLGDLNTCEEVNFKLYDVENPECHISEIRFNEDRNVFEFYTSVDPQQLRAED